MRFMILLVLAGCYSETGFAPQRDADGNLICWRWATDTDAAYDSDDTATLVPMPCPEDMSGMLKPGDPGYPKNL